MGLSMSILSLRQYDPASHDGDAPRPWQPLFQWLAPAKGDRVAMVVLMFDGDLDGESVIISCCSDI